MAIEDLEELVQRGGHHGRDVGRGAARHRPGVHRRTWSRCVRSRDRRRAPRTSSRCSRSRRSSRATATATRACRTPTRCAARRRSPAPRGTRSRTAATVAGDELASAIDNPMVMPDGRVASCGNFHGAPGRLRLRLPRDRGRRGRRDQRAADRPHARLDPLATGCRRSSRPTRRQLRPDDRPVHAGRDRRREPAPGGARPASTRCRRARCRRTMSR